MLLVNMLKTLEQCNRFEKHAVSIFVSLITTLANQCATMPAKTVTHVQNLAIFSKHQHDQSAADFSGLDTELAKHKTSHVIPTVIRLCCDNSDH